jgi:hypothetical protein
VPADLPLWSTIVNGDCVNGCVNGIYLVDPALRYVLSSSSIWPSSPKIMPS